MIEWRNLKKLHAAQAVRIDRLTEENKALKVRNKELEAQNAALHSKLTDITYQLAEVRTVLFGKRQAARAQDDEDDEDTTPRPPRTRESYQRPIPPDEKVTKTIYHRFPRPPKGDTRLRTYWEEDIPLDTHALVYKHVVEQRYDPKKRAWVSSAPLPTATVILGDNVRMLVATLITIERLSFSQVRGLLQTLFGLSISDGEIAKILTREAVTLRPAEDALHARIREETSHHLDESRYDVAGETRYVWSMTGGTSGDTVYRLGVSRGKGVAEALRGDSTGVLVSDDYGAYRTLAKEHQLCFAHLIRKFRDLAGHDGFGVQEKEAVLRTYREIKDIYHAVVRACSGPDPHEQHAKLTERFAAVATVHTGDPVPCVRLKTTLARNIPKYLTCLAFPLIALTNNAAERALRHVVLKRKISYGCRSEQGAATLGTLLSVLLSLWRKDPAGYFARYVEVRRV
jgi:transposase